MIELIIAVNHHRRKHQKRMLKRQQAQRQPPIIIHFIIRELILHIMATVNTMHKHMATVMGIISGNNNMVQVMAIMGNGVVTAVADTTNQMYNVPLRNENVLI